MRASGVGQCLPSTQEITITITIYLYLKDLTSVIRNGPGFGNCYSRYTVVAPHKPGGLLNNKYAN